MAVNALNQPMSLTGDRRKFLPLDDYSRLKRALDIYTEVQTLLAGHTIESFEQDRILVLAVMRLVDTIATNVARLTYRNRVPGIDWDCVRGIKAHLCKVKTVPDIRKLWQLLTQRLPEIMESVRAAVETSVPMPMEESQLPSTIYARTGCKNEQIPYKTVFKASTSRAFRSPHPVLTSAMPKLCSLDDPAQEAARVKLETWFQRLSDTDRKVIQARLRTADDVIHVAAYYELLFHELFAVRGYDIAAHSVIAGHRPDYLMSKGDTKFFLEVLSVWEPLDVQVQRAAMATVFECIDDVARDFLVRVEFLELPGTVDRESLRNILCDAFRECDPHARGEHELKIDGAGVSAILKVRARHGIFSNTSVYEWTINRPPVDDAELAVARALNKNIKHLADSQIPIVLAVCGRDNVRWERTNLLHRLFGDVSIRTRREGNQQVQLHHNGRGLTPEKNTRISAIAFCTRRWDRSQLVFDLEVVHNPWAQRPLSTEVFADWPQLVPTCLSPNIELEWI
jgi:uncharacterized protein with HEPN domain